jgi:hypothetical protein
VSQDRSTEAADPMIIRPTARQREAHSCHCAELVRGITRTDDSSNATHIKNFENLDEAAVGYFNFGP